MNITKLYSADINFRGEVTSGLTTVVLFVMTTFVAYMRWRVKPISPRWTASNWRIS